jgi:hypothetical protein
MYHLIQQLYSQQQSVTCHFPVYMFRPLYAHPQGGLEQRNTMITDSVRDVRMWSQNKMFSNKIMKSI